MTVDFELVGRPFLALNGGPEFTPSEAVSSQISCRTQDEVDHSWETRSARGEQGPCGWLMDRFELSWQVVPEVLPTLLSDLDQGRLQRVMAEMLRMKKLEIDRLVAAGAST